MKSFIAFTCLLAVAAAIDEVTVLRNDAEVKPDGYNYAYELSNGVSASEAGELKDDNIVVHGEFKFTSPEGESFQVSYIADENGFQPTGDHLPVAPEVPVLIKRALEYLAGQPISAAPPSKLAVAVEIAPLAEVADESASPVELAVPAEEVPQEENAESASPVELAVPAEEAPPVDSPAAAELAVPAESDDVILEQ